MRSVLVLFIAAMLAGCFEPSVEYSGDPANKAEEEAAEEAAEQVPDPLLEPPSMERGKAIMDSDLEESDEEEETG